MADSSISQRTLVGEPRNHWLYDVSDLTFDLTRPSPPDFPVPSPNASMLLTTTTKRVLISPSKTALVIIDMQNFFLSTFLGHAADSAGNRAAANLLDKAVPAARKAGVRVVWLNWGLVNNDIQEMPPSVRRAFGFEKSLDHAGMKESRPDNGKSTRMYRGLGSEIGSVTVENGKSVDAGPLLMRDTWNADLPPALKAVYNEGRDLGTRPDVWIHKNRMSGLWGSSTPCTDFLAENGITTLLFAGVNTDQCVSGSVQDAFNKGWDCILLRDACGTTSPDFAREGVEYNCAGVMGFVAECSALEEAVEGMLTAS